MRGSHGGIGAGALAGGPGGRLAEAGAMGWNVIRAIALSSSQTSLEALSVAIVIGEGTVSCGLHPG